MKIQKIVLILLSLFIFVGCTQAEQTSSNQLTSQIENPTKTEDSSEVVSGQTEETAEGIVEFTPQTGGELNISMRMPKTLNPLINEDVTVDNMLKLVFEPLFTINNDDLKPVPNIASGYTISQDGMTVNIDIKPGLRWHNGASITAKDVVFSLDTIKNNPNSLYTSALDKVESYGINGSRVIIKYKEPYSFFAYNLCFPIIPKGYYEGNLDLEDKESLEPIGSGSYKFKQYRLANELILEKTEHFKGMPYIDTIKVIITPDYETDMYAFERNVTNSLFVDFEDWGNLNPNREKTITGIFSNSFEYLGFNFEKDIFKNLELRKAIAYSIPKEEIVENIYLSNAVETLVPVNPYSFLGASTVIENYNYDIKLATEALSKANISNENAKFTLLVNTENKQRIEIAELIKSNLKQIGIEIEIIEKPFEAYVEDLEAGNFDLFLAGIDFGMLPNYQSFLMSSGTGEGGINYQNYSDAKMDALINTLYKAVSEQKFIEASAEMQKYFSEQLPLVGITFKDKLLLTDIDIKGDKKPNLLNGYNNIEKWYIDSN